MNEFERGFFLGLLVGEGHFGGDGRQPHITLRMHVRHKKVFDWLVDKILGSRLYGPYHHGGRDYFQWMVRGDTLKKTLIPLLDNSDLETLDGYAFERYVKMKTDYLRSD